MSFITSEILNPLTRRIGTAFGAWLVAMGVQGDTATTIAAGAVAALSVGLDLLLSSRARH